MASSLVSPATKINNVCNLHFVQYIPRIHTNQLKNVKQLTTEEIRQRKFLKRGLQLSILVLGQCGTGKSSFINALCDEDIIATNRSAPPDLILEEHNARIYEGGTQINLDITMAPGFGDFIDNKTSTVKITEFIDAQFDRMLNEECRIQRNPKSKDTRIHAALYFIRPTGKGLRELDIEIMREVGRRCNLIPIISKSDLLTTEEKYLNRELIMKDIKEKGIQVYDFSACFDDVDEAESESIMDLVPFAIVSGSERKIIDQVEHKVRIVPHGVIEIDNPEHSDFMILRTCLLGACLQDLKDTTHTLYYENYRTNMLSKANVIGIMNQNEEASTKSLISRISKSEDIV